MQNEIHEGSIIKFLITVSDSQGAVDISECVAKKIIFQKPDKTVVYFDATFNSTGTDGKIYYTTTSSTFNKIGLYRYQVYLQFSGGSVVYSDTGEFRVFPNLELF